MIDVSKSKKMATTTSSFAKTQSEKTMYYWRCGKFDHTKNNSNCFKKKKDLHIDKSKTKIKMAKIRDKFKKKKLKSTYCGKLSYNKDNCFILHPYKEPTLYKKKALKTKISKLEKKFNNAASLGQVIRSHIAYRSRISYSFSKHYIFGALQQMVVIAAICTQAIAKNMTPMISKVLESLFGRPKNCGDSNIHIKFSLFFGLVNVNSTINPLILTST